MRRNLFRTLLNFLLFFQVSLLISNEYFSHLQVSDTLKINDARDLVGIGPHLIELRGTRHFEKDITLRAHFFKAEKPKSLLLGVHGLQSNARWFLKSGTFLAKNGISFLIYDRRGSGLSDGNPALLRIKDYLHDNDPNSKAIKVSPGLRGHVFVGPLFRPLTFSSTQQFINDIENSFDKLVDMNRSYQNADGSDLDVYVYANCFGSRIALPFVEGRGLFEKPVRGLIVSAPATDMNPQANLTGIFKKAKVALPLSLPIGPYNYSKTPLKDSYFVSPSHPAYSSIQNDKISLSLRYVTNDFLYAANNLSKKLEKSVSKLKVPLLIVLASIDKIAENDKIISRFKKEYQGPAKVLTFQSEHMMEFEPASAGFFEALKRWIELDQSSSNPTAMSTQGLPYLLSQETLSKKRCACRQCECPASK